jgi:hypothetical protein
MPQWEYLVATYAQGWWVNGQPIEETRPFPDLLQEWGRDGWELVATSTAENTRECIFKRPKQ